ncbi:MAG: Activator of Hsp90 ATPase [Myxococcales bacterium]|nr:Activator of Hsp90 ATPase [Myxococcales bacterium]
MDAKRESEPSSMKNATKTPTKSPTKTPTTMERTSERELVVTRTVNGPARLVFEAWANPELFKRWWIPKSFGLVLLSCEMDVRTGGKYRLVFDVGDSKTMAAFGTYIEVTPPSRLVWTNEDGSEGGPVTTLTFEEKGGQTLLVMHELYPSKEALDGALASGEKSGMNETLDQLDELLVTLDSR